MMLRALTLLSIALSLTAQGAGAQSLEDLARREAALIEAWEKLPLTVRRAVFVAERPTGFGMYAQRRDSVFKPGEPLVIYAEPVGYGWKDAGNGQFDFGLDTGFVIKRRSGEVLGGNQNFGKLAWVSHVRNREVMVNLTLNVTGLPPGDYVVEFQLRDITGSKTASFELPFQIKA